MALPIDLYLKMADAGIVITIINRILLLSFIEIKVRISIVLLQVEVRLMPAYSVPSLCLQNEPIKTRNVKIKGIHL